MKTPKSYIILPDDAETLVVVRDYLYRVVGRELYPLGKVITPPAAIVRWKNRLTAREIEVLRAGLMTLNKYQDVADLLGINERTVRTHMSSIVRKSELDYGSKANLYLWAILAGIVDLSEVVQSMKEKHQ